jgi:hypothetical protein
MDTAIEQGQQAMEVNIELLTNDIRTAIINSKVNACPLIVRLAWHASGTFSKEDGTGGSNGATMRFAPESADDANAGLSIARDLLNVVKLEHPEISTADLWVAAGCVAIEFMGGPKIPFGLGRTDAQDGSACPVVGRLPDAAQGAQHLRDVFYRMGFNDQDIVALSGAHTLGRCHESRSGFDGPWTRTPLTFNNSYFSLLLNLDWQPRKWDGPLQYEAVSGGWNLMMLPTDMVIRDDPAFLTYAQKYADDQDLWFKDFASAFSKLISLGCPEKCTPIKKKRKQKPSGSQIDEARFRELAMHGSLTELMELAPKVNIDGKEASSFRTALMKAAFWNHKHVVQFLLEQGAKVNMTDSKGDTALHDAARFGHDDVVKMLLSKGADFTIGNRQGKRAADEAKQNGHQGTMLVLQSSGCPKSKL